MAEKFTITLVRSRIKSRPYTKTDCKYLGPTWNNNIGLQSIEDTPEAMFHVCQILATKPDTCMVTGTSVRPEIIDTDRTLKNFKEELIKYLVLDLDKYEYNTKDLTYKSAIQETDRFISQHLPPEFQNTSYILRFSSSFLTGDIPYLRCHIIFLLEEPQYPREIGMWIKQDNIPADASFYFNLTQPIFTAFSIWRELVDPLSIKGSAFPRLSLIKKEQSHVLPGWQPYTVSPKHKDPIEIANLPAAFNLPGKVGSFCRMIHPKKALLTLGYSDDGDNRFLAPSSDTGIAGAIIFKNGYVYSHHENDPLNTIVEKVHKFKRKSLNAYDIMYGWAVLHKDTDLLLMKEFDFTLNQAVLNDSDYQDEVLQELIYRTEWLTEGEYEGTNRKIIDSVLRDMHEMFLTELSREHLFHLITAKTKGVTLIVLRRMFKSIRRDQATQYEKYDPDANIRHMANIFKRQKVLYSHHHTELGDFWCYFSDKRVWKKCNISQTKAFIYNHVHATVPLKLEIDYSKLEQLSRLIIREACLHMEEFRRGKGWAFKEGRYGIIMEDLFSDSHQWQSNKAVKTLKKTDHIYKELPITYKQWKQDKDKLPTQYIDFLVSTCEEDMETVELIREYGGYIMADSYYIHKMLIVEGVPGSGKSILAKILQECVGPEYYSAVSVDKMASQFGLGTLPGKKLAIMSEARGIDFKTLKALVPVLLRIIGQDHIDTEAKFKDIKTELLECKILMMTNRTPVLPDDTGALSQRLMILRFNKIFRGTSEEILGLDKLILSEGLCGIINWHLKGLERLGKRRIFIEPKSGLAVKLVLEAQIDPLKTFIDCYFTIDTQKNREAFITQKDFIHLFRAYCVRLSQPSDKPLIRKRASIRNIKSLYPLLSIKRVAKDQKQLYIIMGLVPAQGLELEFGEEIEEMLLD